MLPSLYELPFIQSEMNSRIFEWNVEFSDGMTVQKSMLIFNEISVLGTTGSSFCLDFGFVVQVQTRHFSPPYNANCDGSKRISGYK